MNIFEYAARNKLRFPSIKGLLSVEHLFDMPLTSKSGFDLDTVARSINSSLKALTEESFVETKADPAREPLTVSLEIVKHVIAIKQEEYAKARDAAARKAEREKLMSILANKQDQALQELSPEELQKKIAELGATD